MQPPISKIENITAIQANQTEWRNLLTTSFSPIKKLVDLVNYPVITEKTFKNYLKYNQYTFDVDINLTKSEIKQLFEIVFPVKIIALNTLIPPRKTRRVGSTAGYRPRYKRVILTLAKNEKLGEFKPD
jgi:large subunit ribosomal protein L23